MNKKRAVEIICESAKIYNEIFVNNKILVIYNNPIKPLHTEICGFPKNFAHLTGVDFNENIKDNSANLFFEKALNHKLSVDDFEIKSTTQKKLEILLQTLKINSNAKMIADYEPSLQNRPNLKTGTIIGGERSYIGFVKDNGKFVPNTLINGSIKKDSIIQSRVLAILSKGINELAYNQIKYVAKNIEIDKLLKKIKDDVAISPDLFEHNTPKISAPPTVNQFSSYDAPLPSPDGTATIPRSNYGFGQAISSFFGKIKQFINDKSTKNQRMINDLQKALTKRDKQLSERNKEIIELKGKCSDLTIQLENVKQKQPVLTATKSKGRFVDNLPNFEDRIHSENAAKSQQQGKPNLKPTDKPKL